MRKGIMLCYPFEPARLAKWNTSTYMTEPKLDGDRCRAILGDKVQLLSSQENLRNFSVPHIVAELERFKSRFHALGIYELDGELYKHRSTFEQIRSIVARSKNLHPEHESISFYCFDHIVETTPNSMRKSELLAAFADIDYSYLQYVPAFMAFTPVDILKHFQDFLNFDYEGIIIRHPDAPYVRKRAATIMKFKPKKSDTYTIIGWKEEHDIDGKPKDRLGSIILTSNEGTEFSVSAGLNDFDREHYWSIRETLVGKKATVHYQATTSYGTPKFATNIEIHE